MRLATLQSGKEFILYDAGILWDANGTRQIKPDPAWFTAAFWQARGAVIGQAPGRGSSLFVDAAGLAAGDRQWVLRGYRRGGFAARLSDSRYLWLGLERTRAFRELRLTALLHEEGLPVPQPIAGLVRRHGPSYEAALLTVRLIGARTLAELLPEADAALLERVGTTIRRFHRAGLDHVDLNARNLLVTADGRVWLIDLDRCRLRRPGRWQQANLARLERSLARFSPDDARTGWRPLWQGYHQS
ncbi:3-deoxy-D-manno-octulosonic acid kinase [Modicisalibacter ilicicola DSM 19980]|uniref:3-deoxy-D-manno-octulosonic acid kinase n=1 Tax=Modicisalibacter ilicicola DSM 19980 TaxID=1121942 RepID=A0A1M4VRD9_9GAMM|nr:3-deoxy-D-manno-octulosonic acid kinase [Halomonas ilicicola]SHE71624.1 3-deoxy-D-manno-octulosonic acid kinase [Halomonas ilicicola DSM 19980]